MAEAPTTRWRRRATTIPTMLALTVVAIVGFPILVPALVFADLVRLRRRLPTLRVYLVVLQYLINDSVEILAAPLLWLAAGFGTSLDSPASMARHERLQWWSAELLATRAEQLLGIRVEIEDEHAAALTPGPVIVISRHVSVLDASLPGLVYHEAGFRVTGVIMAELLADPGFDLIYGRLGSVFIPRDDGPAARAEIQAMAASADERTALLLFPEGRLFTPAGLQRSLERLTAGDPARADRLANLRNLLPPRPGGFVELLAALPDADVVLLDHRGLDRYATLGDLLDGVPADQPVTVTVTRFARISIPEEPADQEVWLDERWIELDRAIA